MTSSGLVSRLHKQEGLCWVWHCVYCSGHKALVKHKQVQYQDRKRGHKNCLAGPLTPRKRWMGVWIRNCTLTRHAAPREEVWGGELFTSRSTVHRPWFSDAQRPQPRQLPWRAWPSGSHWQRRPSPPSQWPGSISWTQPVNGQKWGPEALSWIAGSWVWEGLVSSAFISQTFQLQSLSD